MPFFERDGIRAYSFERFPSAITQAVFTRRGGVSPTPWDSLNFGGTVGDDLANVRENRLRAFAAMRRDPASLFDVWQVHSADVAFGDQPRDRNMPEIKADIILTDNPKVTLLMRFADCTPLLFYDHVKNVVGLAHAGWMGTVRGVAQAAVKAMSERYGSRPADIKAAIGPAIGPDHYEVGQNVIEAVRQFFGADAPSLLPTRDGSTRFDLWAANRISLERAGVAEIEAAEICTMCHPEDWYSHRGEYGRTGRFGAMIALNH